MLHILLDKVTSTGPGEFFNEPLMPSRHTVQVILGGTVVATACTVNLQGSLDEINAYTLFTYTLTAADLSSGTAIFHVVNRPVRHVRANLVTLDGGTDPTVTVLHEAGK